MSPTDTYLDAIELQAMHQTVKVKGKLPGEMAERLIREHARLGMLSNDLILISLGCPLHKAYRGTQKTPPKRECKYCRSLWEFHQEHDKTWRFQEMMAEQRRRVDALLAGPDAEIANLRAALLAFVDDEPCRLRPADGRCIQHEGLGLSDHCDVARAREVLGLAALEPRR